MVGNRYFRIEEYVYLQQRAGKRLVDILETVKGDVFEAGMSKLSVSGLSKLGRIYETYVVEFGIPAEDFMSVHAFELYDALLPPRGVYPPIPPLIRTREDALSVLERLRHGENFRAINQAHREAHSGTSGT